MRHRKVACIIPVKDRGEMAIEAINSVITPKRAPDEIIVIDDGSQDSSFNKIKRHFSHLEQLKIIKTKGIGPGAARNLGAKVASSDVLMFLDSDDLWLDNHLESLLNGLDGGHDAAFGITQNIDLINGQTFLIPGDEFKPQNTILENLVNWCSIVPSSFAIKKELFLKIGGFDHTDFGEDWCFFLKLSFIKDIHFLDDIITIRRLHKNNICKKNFSPEKAINLLNRLISIVSDYKADNYIVTLKKTKKITKKELGKICQNVQEWYMALKKHKIF